MKYFIRNIQAATFILIASNSHAYGDYGNPPSFEENQCCYSVRNLPARDSYAPTSSIGEPLRGGSTPVFHVEFSDTTTSEGFVTSRFNGRSKDPHFQWNRVFVSGQVMESMQQLGCRSLLDPFSF